jgi:pimeloyl-ACP methyl ester carboxylesterase
MPVAVVHGTADDIIPVSQPRRLAAAVGDKTDFVYIEIPGGDHDSPLSRIDILDYLQ